MIIDGSTALVTGASRRIGRGIALALAERGCDVAVHFNASEGAALETCAEVRGRGLRSFVVRADLSDADECDRLWHETVNAFGETPRIIVNCASVFERAELKETSADDFDRTMAVNVRAPMLLAKLMARDIGENDVGKVVNINDHRQVYESRFAYGVSNAALSGLTRSLAISLAARIQVNELLLGPILPLSDSESQDAASPSQQTLGPAARFGELDEVCRAVIAVIENDYINGASLAVDGGLSAKR